MESVKLSPNAFKNLSAFKARILNKPNDIPLPEDKVEIGNSSFNGKPPELKIEDSFLRNASGIKNLDISSFFNAKNFNQIWISESPFNSYVTYQGAMVSKDGSLFSGAMRSIMRLDPESGSIKWKKDFSGEVRSWPADEGKDGTLIVRTNDRILHALDPSDGREKWSFKMNDSICKPSVGPDGTIYTEDNSDLVALNPDGSEKYRVAVGKKGEEFSNKVSAVSPDNIAFVKSNKGIMAISSSGSLLWDSPGLYVSCFPGDPEKVYLKDSNGKLTARDIHSGQVLWETGEADCIMEASKEHAFLRKGNEIICMDEKGNVVWKNESGSLKSDEDIRTHFLSDDGVLYISREERTLEALDSISGKPILKVDLGAETEPFINKAISREGTLYITNSTKLFGIDTKTHKLISGRDMDFKVSGIATNGKGDRVYVDTTIGKGKIVSNISEKYKIVAFENSFVKELNEAESSKNSNGGIIDDDGYIIVGGLKLDKNLRN